MRTLATTVDAAPCLVSRLGLQRGNLPGPWRSGYASLRRAKLPGRPHSDPTYLARIRKPECRPSAPGRRFATLPPHNPRGQQGGVSRHGIPQYPFIGIHLLRTRVTAGHHLHGRAIHRLARSWSVFQSALATPITGTSRSPRLIIGCSARKDFFVSQIARGGEKNQGVGMRIAHRTLLFSAGYLAAPFSKCPPNW
jgi:hypothetical protein